MQRHVQTKVQDRDSRLSTGHLWVGIQRAVIAAKHRVKVLVNQKMKIFHQFLC